MPEQILARSRLRFGPKNYVCLAAAIVSLVVGYWLLAKGSTTLAPVLPDYPSPYRGLEAFSCTTAKFDETPINSSSRLNRYTAIDQVRYVGSTAASAGSLLVLLASLTLLSIIKFFFGNCSGCIWRHSLHIETMIGEYNPKINSAGGSRKRAALLH